MKKILFFSGLILLLSLSQTTVITAQRPGENIKTKGKISSNSENEANEADPPFAAFAIGSSLNAKLPQIANQQLISDLGNGLQMIKDILNRMLNNEFNFALLSSHKYMVNNCLGIKVSAGAFNLKFEKPVVEISSAGKISIKLEVNKINFTALKIRMRPCDKPAHLGSPCHFGNKFELSGEATNLVLRATVKPVANGVPGSQGFCFLSFQGNLDVKWTIGGLNLKPLQNNLDYLAKEMIEDALNGGMDDFFYNKFIENSRQVIPTYYSHCENAYDLQNQVNNVSAAAVSGDPNNNSDNTKEAQKWEITPVSTMKGVLGRLNTQFPAGVDWSVDIRSTENKFITNRSGFSNHGPAQDIAPGTYNFQLNTITVENVPIEKGKQTRLKTGVISIVSEGDWHLYDETKEKFRTSGNKPKKFALPIGNYQLKLGGQFFPVEIKDGKEAEF